jgi:alkylation response protein AidB-like acyl-CoA dehydrogenase
MDFDDAPEDAEFREEFRAWLAANHPGPAPRDPDAAFDFRRAWQRTLFDAGWAAPSWPAAWGGRDATIGQLVVYQEELALASAPPIVNAIGVWNIGPTLLEHGTEEQRARWLPGMLSGDEIWCQGFSEPGAGSDLASLQTRAVQDGDAYVVTGQKVWTSNAHRADRCFLLCRTEPEPERKHQGMTLLVLDMHAQGVEARPIREMSGDAEFDEVFLEDVRVPAGDRVGEEGNGWQVAMSTLTHERVGTVTYGVQLRQRLDALMQRPEMWPRDDLPRRVLNQDLARVATDIEIIRLIALRAVTKASRGEAPWPEVSLGKLLWSTASQDLAALSMTALGADGLRLRGDERAADEGRWARDELYMRMTTIGAGTTEVQKNILAERALGLPRG